MTYKPSNAGEMFADHEARLKKLEAAAAPPPAAPLWSCDFTRPLSYYGFNLQAKDESRFSNVHAHGMRMARLETRPGDNNIAGSGANERCDLRLSNANTDGVEGREQWWSHVIVFPADYVDPPPSPENAQPWNFGTVFNFHNTTDGAGQANFAVNAMPVTATSPDRPTGLNLQMAFGNQAGPVVLNYPVGPIARNVPYWLKYHVLWTSTDALGYFDAWVNGVLKMQYKGPTLYPGQGVYLKCANYHSPHGKPSAVLHGRIARGTTEASVA
jgi:hypothetical protein